MERQLLLIQSYVWSLIDEGKNDFNCDLVPDSADKEGLPILEHYLTVPSIRELEQNHFKKNI